MKISSRSRYALESLVYMAAVCDGQPATIKRVAEETAISERFLEQIFYRLRGAGLLLTRRGPGGGFLLARPADQVTAAQVLQAMEEELTPVLCAREGAVCSGGRQDICATRALWVAVSERIDQVLSPLTLAELAGDWKGGVPL